MSAVADAKRGDFTANPRVLVVTLMAVFIGVASAFVALALTKLIGFFTNLFYYQRIAIGDFTSPAARRTVSRFGVADGTAEQDPAS